MSVRRIANIEYLALFRLPLCVFPRLRSSRKGLLFTGAKAPICQQKPKGSGVDRPPNARFCQVLTLNIFQQGAGPKRITKVNRAQG